jgi:hypothetical protein
VFAIHRLAGGNRMAGDLEKYDGPNAVTYPSRL